MAGLFGGGGTNAQYTASYTQLEMQTSAEGVCIPIVWGVNRISTNLLWTENFQKHGTGGKKGGGKGGGGGKSGTPTTYSATVIMGLCEGPIGGVLSVFKDNTETTIAALGLTLYLGTATQTPFYNSPVAYPLTAYLGAINYNLGPSPTAPQHNFEVIGFRAGSVPGSYDVNPALCIFDLLTNTQYGLGMPATMLGDYTAYWSYCQALGILFSPALTSQEQAISTLQRWAQITNTWIFYSENKIKFVPLGDTAIVASGTGPIVSTTVNNPGAGYSIGDILYIQGGAGDATLTVTQVNTDSKSPFALGCVTAYYVSNPGSGYSTANAVPTSGGTGGNPSFYANVFVPANASYTPNLTPIYALTYDDFLSDGTTSPVTVTRIDPSDAYNWIKVQVKDRNNQYSGATVEYKDQNSIELYGLTQASDIQADEICQRATGLFVAAILGKRSVYVRNTYTFKLGYNYVLLEPGDIVSLTDPAIGLEAFPVRIRSMEENDKGELTFIAEECPQAIGTPITQSAPQPSLAAGPPAIDIAPGNVNAPIIVEPPVSVTGGTAQIWVGLSGSVSAWGGAQVWASSDGVTYVQLGNVTEATPQGVLLSPLAAHADPDNVDTLAVDLAISQQILSSSVVNADADALRTLILLDSSELVAYGGVLPNAYGAFAYDLRYLRRGVYSSTISAHAAGVTAGVLIPNRMLQMALPAAYIGQMLYLKFPSFNLYGSGLQDISTVARYSYTPLGVAYSIAPPTLPVLSTATVGRNISVSLGWGASPGPQLGSYEVQMSADGGVSWTAVDIVVGATALNYTLTAAHESTSYVGRVRAIAGNGLAASAYVASAVLTTGTLPVIVSAPTTSVFTQTTPITHWDIVHNLGRFPTVLVLDAVGNTVEGDIVYVSVDEITITFSIAFAGVAYLN